MGKKSSPMLALEKELKKIEHDGIKADQKQLKKDMCAQFRQHREWVREYVVNASDAKAIICRVSGREDDLTITIVVEDDGHGMDGKGVRDFCTVYRSVKKGDVRMAVGRHGVGKLSVAAIPGQCGFIMLTSTGGECWRMEAGCLLDDKPIKLERVEPVPPQGTRFEITFRKENAKHSLQRELFELGDILDAYVRYLPMKTVIFEREGNAPDSRETPRLIEEAWSGQRERFSRRYTFTINGREYDAVFGIGTQIHEIYQNRVMISGRYNLLSHDLRRDLDVPHLTIRCDSPDFELPFGRHCLRNENDLGPLAKHMRTHILPQYMAELCSKYNDGQLGDFGIHPAEVEEIAVKMMEYDSSNHRSWSHVPVFRAWNQPRLSLAGLRKIVQATDVLFLEKEDDMGADYSMFKNVAVLLRQQPKGGIELLKSLFKKQLINLSIDHVILEAPPGTGPPLGMREKNFEKFLGFHPEALRLSKKRQTDSASLPMNARISIEDLQRLAGVCEESRMAKEDISRLKWRVNYLVTTDGVSPCTNHRFLFKNETVILNLNHPEIQELLSQAEKTPVLSGFLALAMCLTDNNKILPHLTPEAREDLILMDAIAKCGTGVDAFSDSEVNKKNIDNDEYWQEFLRNIEDENLGLN